MSQRLGQRRWVWLGLVATVGLAALVLRASPWTRRVTGERLKAYLPTADQLAAVCGAEAHRFRAVPPPVNPDYAETAARALSRNRVPLPDDRAVVTFRRIDREAETTVALLLYDRPADMEQVESLASGLIEQALGLEAGEVVRLPSGLDHQGAQGRRWQAPGYRALTFRAGSVFGFIGSTDPEAESWLEKLAGQMAAQLLSHPPATATPGVASAHR